MKSCSKHIIIMLVWLLVGVMPAMTATTKEYKTDLIKKIAQQTNLYQHIDTLTDGEHTEWGYYKSLPITVIVEDNCVTHIGYSIFSSAQRAGIGRCVCNFLERYYLEIDASINEQVTSSEKMQIDNVKVLKGGFGQLRELSADSTVLINLQIINEREYIMGWHRDTTWLCQISFPIEYNLLAGVNMDERERRLSEELSLYHATAIDTLHLEDINQMTKAWQDNYYTFKRGSYLLENLSANLYFEKNDSGNLVPIFNKLYPIESLANLFTSNLVENNCMLVIKLRKYGFKSDSISVPLRDWVSYCQQTGCKPYLGIISMEESGDAVCELVMHNREMGYNHIMKMTVPMNILRTRKGHILARLNSYVTASRIKNLFGEKE